MGFNTSKCGVMHLGKNNLKFDYKMKNGDEYCTLNKTVCEKDLGVFVDKNLKFDEHISQKIKKARSMSGMIYRNIIHKTPTIMVPLFKSMIRPHIEYGNAVWCPYLKQDKCALENVQRNFTKKIHGMKKKSYYERLKILRLPSLEFRRLRGDMIEVFKIVHGIYDTNTTNKFFTKVCEHSSTRKSNNLNLLKKRVNTNPFQKFFTNRVINTWNALPNDIVNTVNVNSFKNKFDVHFKKFKYSTNLDHLR